MEDRLRRIEQLRRSTSEVEEDTGNSSRKRTVDKRSPQMEGGRVNRMRMDEFVIGQKFTEISSGMRTEFNRLIQTIENPDLMLDGLKTAVKLGMEAIVGHMEAIMNSISDMESQARRVQEADMMVVDDRLDKVANKVRELDCCCDTLVKGKVEQRNAESKKEMESKLVTSMAQFKIVDISFV